MAHPINCAILVEIRPSGNPGYQPKILADPCPSSNAPSLGSSGELIYLTISIIQLMPFNGVTYVTAQCVIYVMWIELLLGMFWYNTCGNEKQKSILIRATHMIKRKCTKMKWMFQNEKLHFCFQHYKNGAFDTNIWKRNICLTCISSQHL